MLGGLNVPLLKMLGTQILMDEAYISLNQNVIFHVW